MAKSNANKEPFGVNEGRKKSGDHSHSGSQNKPGKQSGNAKKNDHSENNRSDNP